MKNRNITAESGIIGIKKEIKVYNINLLNVSLDLEMQMPTFKIERTH